MFARAQLGLKSVFLTKYYSSDHIEKNDMGEKCSTYGVEEICIEGFGRGRLR
jgi:hypothetical protein